MTGRSARAMTEGEMEQLLRRQSTAAETRRHLQRLPQFKADHDLPEALANLLGRLRMTEERTGRG